MNSDLLVRHLRSGELQVVAPPNHLLTLLFAAISLVPAIYFLYRAVRVESLWPLLGLLLFSLPFGIAALGAHRHGSVVLDKTANTATVSKPSWLWQKSFTLPLSDIQRAEIHSRRNGTSIALILQDGNSLGFFDFTDQAGQGRAAQAINDFLGVPRR